MSFIIYCSMSGQFRNVGFSSILGEWQWELFLRRADEHAHDNKPPYELHCLCFPLLSLRFESSTAAHEH